MSAPQFTPGPWRACKNGDCSCGHIWSIPADFHLATAQESWGDDPQYPDATMPLEEMQANARLIAAAPQLYDGCNALLGLLQLLAGRDDINDEVRACLTYGHRIADATAAVAKARGEA